MTDTTDDLLRELVALSRQQLANQEAALARQETIAARLKRRSTISLALVLVNFIFIAYVIYLIQVIQGYRR